MDEGDGVGGGENKTLVRIMGGNNEYEQRQPVERGSQTNIILNVAHL